MDNSFFSQNGIDLAKSILGKFLIRKYEDIEIVTKIVEAEAYMGVTDKGAHVYNDKKTQRTWPLYLDGGHIYVYLIYGMYYCLNLSANEKDNPQCVLIRAVEPVTKLDEIAMNRYKNNYENLTNYQKKNITNGHGKLCMALRIDKNLNGKHINDGELIINDYYYDGNNKIDYNKDFSIVSSKRVNIDYAQEAKDYLWRFYIKNNKYVSVKDKLQNEL